MKNCSKAIMFVSFLLLLPVLALAAGPSGGSGSGTGSGSGSGGEGMNGGCGDVLGDLIHIKRDPTTGQPILQKRWIEYPQDILDWGYCPIPVTESGEEIGFVDLSCDPLDAEAVVEVDYFGRLSGGRAKERNSRMHFNEVIASIKDAELVRQDQTGRLRLGYGCESNAINVIRCETWSTIDSPMENLALYTRLMKYGHIQTDPLEVDTFGHGDPAAGIQYHPALGPADWDKFEVRLKYLLPGGADGVSSDCFGPGFNLQCSQPETLNYQDFVQAGSFLGGAANKDGKITVDLVQYLNRILKITQATESTAATPDTLPALIRDCGDDPDDQWPTDRCEIYEAPEDLPGPANERFVDFGRASYVREDWRDVTLGGLVPMGPKVWIETRGVSLLGWLEFANGPVDGSPVGNLEGFVIAAADGLRAVEFVHNYEIPEDLGWKFR